MPRIYSANLGVGGGGGVLVVRAGQDSIAGSTQTVVVTFSSPLSSANYAVMFSIANDVDADPIWLQGVVTDKQANGFTVLLNAPTDTANYYIDYQVTEYV